MPAIVIDELIKHEIPVVLKDGVQLFSNPVAQELISAVAISAQVQPEKGWDRWLPKNFKSFAEKISDDKWSTKVKALATLMVKKISTLNCRKTDLAARVVSIDHYKDGI